MNSYLRKSVISLFAVIAFGSAGCSQQQEMQTSPEPAAPQVTKAVAVIHPTEGNETRGLVTFTQTDAGVQVVASFTGLSAGDHGFHIHQYGDCSAPDGTSAGGHYNPESKQHGGPDSADRHVGDLGNVTADDAGNAALDRVDMHLSLNGPNSIVGRGIIIHAGTDDLMSQPTGAAGARLGCGVIGIAKN